MVITSADLKKSKKSQSVEKDDQSVEAKGAPADEVTPEDYIVEPTAVEQAQEDDNKTDLGDSDVDWDIEYSPNEDDPDADK